MLLKVMAHNESPTIKSENPILLALRTIIVPLVEKDGGELYFIGLTDDEVKLHLCGAFSGCPGVNLASRGLIEPAVHAIAPSVRVTVTAGVLVPEGAERMGAEEEAPSSSDSEAPDDEKPKA